MTAYHQPRTLDEAIGIYAADPSLEVLAGGTDIFPARTARAGWGQLSRRGILDISRIAHLRGVAETPAEWSIGSLTTWADVGAADLPPLFNGLKAAAREIGGQQIQNRGTLGGNICNASPAADGMPPLMTLSPRIHTLRPQGDRVIPFQQFVTGSRRTELTQSELLTSISIEKQPGVGFFRKLGARKYLVISIATVAGVFEWDSGGRISKARIVVGACSAVPQRLSALESALRGNEIDPAIARSEHVATLSPIDDIRASAAYRRAAALEIVRDMLQDAADYRRRHHA